MSYLTVLTRYALKTDLSSLSESVLFSHTPTTMTIFDAYPKSNSFHFLLLPRITDALPEKHTTNLAALLKWDKDKAHECLKNIAKDAEDVKGMVRQEMLKRFGFEWPIFAGFHAVCNVSFPVTHLHLHIIASDFFPDTLKNKKHYNSFHPKLGFFLHLDDVLSWFEATSSYYQAMAEMPKAQYEPLLREDLVCWRCDETFKNIPTLKEHLRQEWQKDLDRAKSRKRKRDATDRPDETQSMKRPK
ncbi:hypothetical protein BU17DRAFT_45097 [Hysterangium stoloniferum]|nr:hypothetical protein BU17DRAFT_45097 [Hysterangium stoloniferum]